MTDDAIFYRNMLPKTGIKHNFKLLQNPFLIGEKHGVLKLWSVIFDKSGKTAWFDELLNTQMKICRGSGVLVKVGNDWKIKHYVLTVPNENVTEVVKIKTPIEDALMQK
jgi:hypothetical protein